MRASTAFFYRLNPLWRLFEFGMKPPQRPNSHESLAEPILHGSGFDDGRDAGQRSRTSPGDRCRAIRYVVEGVWMRRIEMSKMKLMCVLVVAAACSMTLVGSPAVGERASLDGTWYGIQDWQVRGRDRTHNCMIQCSVANNRMSCRCTDACFDCFPDHMNVDNVRQRCRLEGQRLTCSYTIRDDNGRPEIDITWMLERRPW